MAIGGDLFRHRLQREREQTLWDQWQRTFAARHELRSNESRARETASRNDSSARHVADQRAAGRVDAWAELHKKFGKLKLE